jgi:hypothetical protein
VADLLITNVFQPFVEQSFVRVNGALRQSLGRLVVDEALNGFAER